MPWYKRLADMLPFSELEVVGVGHLQDPVGESRRVVPIHHLLAEDHDLGAVFQRALDVHHLGARLRAFTGVVIVNVGDRDDVPLARGGEHQLERLSLTLQVPDVIDGLGVFGEAYNFSVPSHASSLCHTAQIWTFSSFSSRY